MKGAGADAAVAGRADHPGHGVTGAVVVGGGELHNGIVGAGDEVGKLHLDHRAQAHQRHARGHAREGHLGQGGVEDPLVAKLLPHGLGDLERAAKCTGHILAQNKHIRVPAHFQNQGLADGGDIAHLSVAAVRGGEVQFFGLGEAEIACNGFGDCISRHRRPPRRWQGRARGWTRRIAPRPLFRPRPGGRSRPIRPGP